MVLAGEAGDGIQNREAAGSLVRRIIRSGAVDGFRPAGKNNAGAIGGNGEALFIQSAADGGGDGHGRIDHQGLGGVVLTEMEARLVAGQENEVTGDRLALAVDGLIDERLVGDHHAASGVEFQIAVGIDGDIARAIEGHADLGRIGTRVDDKVVFELALVTGVDGVNAGVNVFGAHFSEVRDSDDPLGTIVAKQVVALAGLEIFPSDFGRLVSIAQCRAQDRVAIDPHYGFIGGQKSVIAFRPGQKLHGLVRLPLIYFKGQRLSDGDSLCRRERWGHPLFHDRSLPGIRYC